MDIDIRGRIAQSYNLNSKFREGKEIVSWKVDELEKFVISMKSVDGRHVLDLGAGSGNYANYISHRGFNVKCIDISSAMIELCKDKGLDAEVMDFYNLDFEEQFDGIWSMNTLLHVPKMSIRYVLKGVKKVLKPRGIFYLGIYGGSSTEGIYEDDFYEPKRYFSRYDDEELIKILECHFEIVGFEHITLDDDNYWFQSVIMRNVI